MAVMRRTTRQERAWIRFLRDNDDICYANGESPHFDKGAIIQVYATADPDLFEISYGCGQHAMIHTSIEGFEVLSPLELIAFAADGQLDDVRLWP